MAREEPPHILIAGGYGVFGSVLARELLDSSSASLIIAGRHRAAAARRCRSLDAGGRCQPEELDLQDLDAVRRAASRVFAVVCAAGPFQALDPRLPEAVSAAGAHWLDISDEEDWVIPLLNGRANAASPGRTLTLTGLSTVPALSGVLVRWLCRRVPASTRARITLFIGNSNRKGAGAIASALASPLSDPVEIELPVGRRMAYRFRSPDARILGDELALDVEFRVAFEWAPVAALLRLARLFGQSPALARWLQKASAPLRFLGTATGCLHAEVRTPDGRGAAAWFLSRGQRLAILPAVFALEDLLAGRLQPGAGVSPGTWLETGEWVERLAARGVRFEECVIS